MIGGSAPARAPVSSSEDAVRGGTPSAGVRAIDHIVVDECCGVEEFKGAGGVEHQAELAPGVAREVEGTDGAVPEHREPGAQSFASGEVGDGFVEERRRVGAQRLELGAMGGEGVVDSLLYKPCESLRFVHAA